MQCMNLDCILDWGKIIWDIFGTNGKFDFVSYVKWYEITVKFLRCDNGTVVIYKSVYFSGDAYRNKVWSIIMYMTFK